MSVLVAAAANITKIGNQVTVTSTQEIQTKISGTSIKFDPLVTFNVGTDEGFPLSATFMELPRTRCSGLASRKSS